MKATVTGIGGWLCLLTVLVCNHISSASGAPGWEIVSRDDGIEVYARPEGRSGLEWLTAKMTVDSTPGAVLALFQDQGNLSEWVSHYRDSQILAQSAMDSFLVYVRMDAPLLMLDRDAVIASRLSWDEQGFWIGSSLDLKAYQPRGDTVPLRRLEACWKVQQISEGHSLIRYQGITDSRTEPAWLAIDYSRDALRATFEGLRLQLRATKYQLQGREIEQRHRSQLQSHPLPQECRPHQVH